MPPYDEEYELIPRKDILELRKEIDLLKQQRTVTESVPGDIPNKELFYAISRLQESINSLINVFKSAKAEMSKDDDANNIIKRFVPLTSKLDEILDQNKKIAKGIIALSDSFNEEIAKLNGDISATIDRKLNAMKQQQQVMRPAAPPSSAFGEAASPMSMGGPSTPPPMPPPQGGGPFSPRGNVPPPIPPPRPPGPDRKNLFAKPL